MATSIHALGLRSTSCQINYLSLDPRPIHRFFDDDGPGELSRHGPRHDNDHVAIRDIHILPTTDEILATRRPPYMPRKNHTEPHFLENAGPRRLLDTLFRHLRYDSIEKIRDVCYNASQILASGGDTATSDYETRQTTLSGNQYHLYRDVQIEELLAHEYKGLLVRASYACPASMRGRNIHRSGRFKEGMLCALIGLDDSDALTTTFFDVHMSQSTNSMNHHRGKAVRAAIQLSFVKSTHYDEVLQISRCANNLRSSRFILLEFPGTLHVSFYWCLKRLQVMQSHDLAFTNYVTPTLGSTSLANNLRASASGSRALASILPPAYSQKPGFLFDITSISNQESRFSLNELQGSSRAAFLRHLEDNTSLDEGQAVALCDNLTREFAFTQGPPGTGKTYLGIALTKVILSSRRAQNSKPLLVVCQTNHALDSFLGGLRDSNVTNLVRIGNGSKEEWTKDINLRQLSRKTRLTERGRDGINLAYRRAQVAFGELDSWCKGFNAQRASGVLGWYAVRFLLEKFYPEIYHQLVTATNVPHAQAFTFDHWAKGGDLKNLNDLHRELRSQLSAGAAHADDTVDQTADTVLADTTRQVRYYCSQTGVNNVWNVSLKERKRFLDTWRVEMDMEWLAAQFSTLHLHYQEALDDVRSKYEEKKANAILQCDIVGMTTTACAQNGELLKGLDLEVVICEEAGEVIEAHTLCTLFPSIQHAIFIGDPLQLRPEVAEQAMSLETELGLHYRLDESLFERVMNPIDPSATCLPISRLLVQRRMHPNIADISRLTYPYLKDHKDTKKHPSTIGLAKRMFWLDHQSPESESINSKSFFNAHEVAIVKGLVHYLLRGSAYSLGDIAVLTPYKGQLAALHESLSATCPVWLSEKDRETLLRDGLFEERSRRVSKHNIKISDLLRIATVDNFQGEEAKIIILTTVRSCGRPGFLKTVNRINVACSRARNGFYMVGNANTLQQVPVWNDVINVFAKNGDIGTTLRTCCDRHPSHYVEIGSPHDFSMIQDCAITCGEILDCGHQCEEKCHALDLHAKIPCTQACTKVLPCGHECTKFCFENCGKCEWPMGERTLPCGHLVEAICSVQIPKCHSLVAELDLPCGHKLNLHCSNKENPRLCNKTCEMPLSCGHLCQGLCVDCFTANKHPPCSSICRTKLVCGHSCDSLCHKGSPCPPCTQPCTESCVHGPCKFICSKACDPCVQPHKPACSHQQNTTILCCLPSDILPCSESCKNVLLCGHLCPSICSERCPDPDLCPDCVSGQPNSKTLIFISTCRHLLDVKVLDEQVLNGLYDIDHDGRIIAIKRVDGVSLSRPTCPCGTPISGVQRYAVVNRLLDVADTLNRLRAKFDRKVKQHSERVLHLEAELADGFDAFCASIRPNPLAAKMNKASVFARGGGLIRERNKIINFRDEVISRSQESVVKLRKLFPSFMPPSRFSFSLEFDLLEYQARSVWLEDILKVADHLAELEDPSYEVQRLSEVIRINATEECLMTIRRCKYSPSGVADLGLESELHKLQRLVDNEENASSGKKTEVGEEEFKASQKFLHEDAFLQAMKKVKTAKIAVRSK